MFLSLCSDIPHRIMLVLMLRVEGHKQSALGFAFDPYAQGHPSSVKTLLAVPHQPPQLCRVLALLDYSEITCIN